MTPIKRLSVNAALAHKRRVLAALAAQGAAPAPAPLPADLPPPEPTGNAALDFRARRRHEAARIHLAELRAQRQEATLQEVRAEQSNYEQQLRDLQADEDRLRAIPRGEARTALLRDELLPKWRPVVDTYLADGKAYPNPIAVLVLIWLFNAGELESALPLADILIDQGQRMPDRFKRELPVFVADALLEGLEERAARQQPAPPGADDRAKDMLDNPALPDIVRIKYAKYLSARAEARGETALALAMVEQAQHINPREAKVTSTIKRLQKALR